MVIKRIISIFCFSLIFIFSNVIGHSAKEVKRGVKPPNIVFILADDLGWAQIGAYGTDYYQTPNIDRLGAEGAKFTNAYAAAAICSPTRASIMTGKYPARLHLTDFISGNNSNQPLQQPKWQKFLPLAEVTFAELLKEAGYKTAHFGKWHLSIQKNPPKSLPYNPDKQGFDETFVTYKPSKDLAQPWQTPENDGHNVDTITNLSIEFIKRHVNNPFFLFVSHNSIHDPIMEKEALIEKYKAMPSSADKRNNPTIAAMIETLDKSTGRILETLDDLGLKENTIVVFFSDNGGKEGYAKQTPLKKGKGWLYEGGIREPFLIRWPNVVKEGMVSDQIVSSIDFYPTFLEMAGVSTPKKVVVDGVSLVPLLKGKSSLNRNTLFWHYPHYHQETKMKPAGAIRDGKYKLIEFYEPTLLNQPGQVELYDLEKDLGEEHDLSSSMPEKVEELRAKLKKWRKDVGAQMPTVNKDYSKKRQRNQKQPRK